MASDTEKQLAYDAGRAANSEPDERRHPDACPFAVGSDEAAEWLRGFADILDDSPDGANLEREIGDAIKTGDSLGD